MKAIVFERYGEGSVAEVEMPVVMDDGVLVRVRAAALNPLDHYFTSGTFLLGRLMSGLTRPKLRVPGVDLAGVVEAVGRGVTTLRVGDEVFGAAGGSLAEVVAAPAARLAPKPVDLTFEQAAAVPVAGLTALQALRDHGRVRAGQHVLVNGAAGGVGSFAVQLACAFGARVTAVCGAGHAELVRSLGAERVVDYTREDFTRTVTGVDLMLDIVGGRSWHECRRVLAREAIVVVIGGPRTDRWVGPAGHVLGMRLGSIGAPQKMSTFIARVLRSDLLALKELIEAGRVTPVIDRRFAFAEAPDALRHLAAGHLGGKVVVSV